MKTKKNISKAWSNPVPPRLSEIANLPELFLSQSEKQRDRPFLWQRQGKKFVSLSYGEAATRARQLASYLISRGVASGDRIILAAENRPDWVIADLAILLAGAIPVPAYTTNNVEDHKYIMEDSGGVGIIASASQLKKIKTAIADGISESRFIVTLDEAEEGIASAWDHIHIDDDVIRARMKVRGRDDLCCIIYTSGTGGRPKGVMISHGAILFILQGASEILSHLGLGKERFLSFLPLSHAYEHIAGFFWPVALGAEIYFASSLDRLMEEIALTKPTLMTAVPRLYEVTYQRLERQLQRASVLQRFLFKITQGLWQKREEKKLRLWEYPLDALMELLVRRKVRSHFGGKLKAFVSGGAALDPHIGRYFLSLGLRILQGYGQTETSPVVSVNLPYRNKIESVGPPLPGVEVRLGQDNEILVRGPNVMMGYWRDEKSTQEALRDGWLHTGDIGALDEDNYLYITGRKKDIIVLTGGDTLSPAKIEQELCREPEIGQAMVDGKSHLVALIVPDSQFAKAWAKQYEIPAGNIKALLDHPAFRQALNKAVDRTNQRLGQNEKIRKFAYIWTPFSIEDQTMTPTLKIRRHVIRQIHRTLLDSLF